MVMEFTQEELIDSLLQHILIGNGVTREQLERWAEKFCYDHMYWCE